MRGFLRTDRTFLAVLFSGIFMLTARNVTDPDVWWHLKTGEIIAQNHSVPRTDLFSYTRAGEPWVAHEWLTELSLYSGQRTLGFGGLILFFSTLMTAAFFLLYLRCGESRYVAGIATLAAAWVTAPLWGARPQMISLFLMSLWLLLLEKSGRNPNLLYWTLPLALLWVNLHAGFAVGLALSFLFLVGTLVEKILRRPEQSASVQRQGVILFLDLLLVGVNPNGWRMLSYPFETLRSRAMQTYIDEWASPNFHTPEHWPFLVLVLATFAVLGWSGKRVRVRDLILLAAGLYAGLSSVRMIPLFVFLAVPLISRRIMWKPSLAGTHPLPTYKFILNATIVLGMIVTAGTRVRRVIERQPAEEARLFPSRAVGFLKAHPPAGPIFNDYNWGGYLIWKLYPETLVFIDGRADIYGEKLLDDYAKTYLLKGGWQEVLLRWSVETVLVPPNSALAVGLQRDSGWVILYKDTQAIVLTRVPFVER